MIEFRMPSLGADMDAGTLVEWLVEDGDSVARGDIVAVVETQKGAIEIEIFETGVIDALLVGLGDTVPVGTPLARLRGKDEPAGASAPPPTEEKPRREPPAALAEKSAPPPPSAAPAEASPPTPAGAEGRVRASPAARRLAAEADVDLAALKGSGPDGAIVRADVAAASGAAVTTPQKAPARRPGFDAAAMREAIAAAMARSKREIPHYYLSHSIDVTTLEHWIAATNVERPPAGRLLIGAAFIKAVAVAALRYEEFNGSFEDGAFRPSAEVHPGVAVAMRGGGLMAPAMRDAAHLDLDELMARLRDLVGRVRSGHVRSSELTSPTITISSLGERGVETLYGVIYPPQVAIVGFGAVARRPWLIEDGVVARSVVTATLAADHRVSDGHRGALFLAEIGRLLQDPEVL